MNEVLLIDGYGLFFRAFYSMPNLVNHKGQHVGGVYVFMKMMQKILAKLRPSYVLVLLDTGGKNFRHGIFQNYKANRSETPAELKSQFGILRVAINAMGIQFLEKQGFEADDLIASMVSFHLEKQITIVSSDKDILQLMEYKHVSVYDPLKHKLLDEQDVIDKFGVAPNKLLEFLSLVGDSADNIPGVPSIGKKTAAAILSKYGSVEDLLKTNDKFANIIRQNFEEFQKALSLIELKKNIPLEIDLCQMTYNLSMPEFRNFISEYGFDKLA